jgi:type IX secretion system PorP/SprF family membrane protein
MSHKFYLVLVLGFCLSIKLNGQQSALSSLFSENQYAFNPALAGMTGKLEAAVSYRKQWLDLLGSPETQTFQANAPVQVLGGGVGLRLERDVISQNQFFNGGLAYSKLIKLGNSWRIGLGAELGAMQYSLNYSTIRTPEGDYNVIVNHNDPTLENSGQKSSIAMDLSAGLALRSSSGFTIGLAISKLMEPKFKLNLSNTQMAIQRHAVFSVSYPFVIGDNFQLQPSLFVRSNLKQFQTDCNVVANYQNKFRFGVGLRGYSSSTLESVSFIAGYQVNKSLSLMYAYDYGLSGLSAGNSGSHEVLVKYTTPVSWGVGRAPKTIFTPRLY